MIAADAENKNSGIADYLLFSVLALNFITPMAFFLACGLTGHFSLRIARSKAAVLLHFLSLKLASYLLLLLFLLVISPLLSKFIPPSVLLSLGLSIFILADGIELFFMNWQTEKQVIYIGDKRSGSQGPWTIGFKPVMFSSGEIIAIEHSGDTLYFYDWGLEREIGYPFIYYDKATSSIVIEERTNDFPLKKNSSSKVHRVGPDLSVTASRYGSKLVSKQHNDFATDLAPLLTRIMPPAFRTEKKITIN